MAAAKEINEVRAVSDWLTNVGIWLVSRSTVLLTFIVVLLLVVRNGLRFSSWEPSISEAMVALPSAINYNSSAIIPMGLAKFIPNDLIDGPLVTLIPQLLTIGLLLLITGRSVARQLEILDRRIGVLIAVLAVALSPMVTILLGSGGFARDWIPILGLAGFAIFSRPAYAFIGLGFAALGNPEQALVAVLILAIASYSPQLIGFRKRALSGLVLAFLIFLPIQIWEKLSGSESRAIFLVHNLRRTLGAFLPDAYVAVYASLAASWVVVVIWIVVARKFGRVWPVVASLCVGYLMMAVTTDGTRVFSIIITPLLLVLIVQFSVRAAQRNEAMPPRPNNLGKLVVAFIAVLGVLMPAATWAVHGGLPATSALSSLKSTISDLARNKLHGAP